MHLGAIPDARLSPQTRSIGIVGSASEAAPLPNDFSRTRSTSCQRGFLSCGAHQADGAEQARRFGTVDQSLSVESPNCREMCANTCTSDGVTSRAPS